MVPFLASKFQLNKPMRLGETKHRANCTQGGSGTEPEPETGTVGTVSPGSGRGTGTAGTVFRNRNRNRPLGLNCIEAQKHPSSEEPWNRKPEPLEPFHPDTVTEPNWGHTVLCSGNIIPKSTNMGARKTVQNSSLHEVFQEPFGSCTCGKSRQKRLY